MKAFLLGRMWLGCALALGLVVVWSTASPSAVSGDQVIGGWTAIPEGCPCDGILNQTCPDGVDWLGNNINCVGGGCQVCDNGQGCGQCECTDTFPCDGVHPFCSLSEMDCV